MPFLKDRLGHVCKPAAQAEKEFYEELPNVYPFLVPFTPKYYGCCTVNINSALQDISTHFKSATGGYVPRVYADGSASQSMPLQVKERWDLFQSRRHKKVSRDADGNVEFIMLEDVTRNHQFSNVVDIKLGSEQYAHQQDPRKIEGLDPVKRQKIERATLKCRNSTSAEYGFRINGMQIYREDKEIYKVTDKYNCRNLDISGTDRALERFLKYPTWDNLAQIRRLIEVRLHVGRPLPLLGICI